MCLLRYFKEKIFCNSRNSIRFSGILILYTFTFIYSIAALAIETERSKPLESVNLQLKWIHQFQFAGYYAAKDQGFYADEGLDVQINVFNQEKSTVQQVVSDEADYAVGDIGILFDYAKGQPIKALAAIFQHNALVYISKSSSGILSPYEMLGKRVMEQATATDDAPLRAMLADVGVTKKNYTSIRHSYNIDDLILDKVDIMSAYMTDQPFSLRKRDVEINIIKPQNYGIDFYGDILFTSNKEISQYPGRSKRFLRASIKGWKYAFKHTEEVIQLIRNQYHSQSSIEQLRQEAIETRKLVLPDSVPLGQIKIARLRYVASVYNYLKLTRQLTDNELDDFIFLNESNLNLNEQEREWLKSHPVIQLGIDRNFPPYEWIDEKGAYRGIAADYIMLLESRLGIKFEIIKDKDSWNDVLAAAKGEELDMLSCLVKTEEREGFLNFSQPYLSSSAVIISEHSNGYIGSLKHLEGKRVAIQKGHFTQELLRKNFPKIEIVSTENISDALQMVSEGQAFAYVGDVTSASFIMKKEGFLNLIFSGSTPYKSQFSFGSQKNLPILTSIINKALSTISQNEKDRIFERWRGFTISAGIKLNLIIKYILIIAVLFFLFVYWIYRLRQSETALKISEAKLQLILDTEPESVKVIDPDGRLLQINSTGLQFKDADDTDQLIGQKVDKFVLEPYRQTFNDMNKRVLAGESCHLEYQIKGLKGTVRWVESHSVPLRDERNKRTSILAVTRDISDRKKIENKQKLVDLVFQHTSEAIMVLNSDNLIIAINPAFSQITGYKFDEVKGKLPTMLNSSLQDTEFYNKMWLSINDTGHWEGEIWNKRKNGELYCEKLVLNTIYSNEGKPSRRVALFSDITEQKEAEMMIWKQANYDPLTQLPNRNMFLDRLRQNIKSAVRSNKTLALIFLDLDHFKHVNDSLGHDSGDELLCQTSQRLISCLRDVDTVTRLGGDEFVIILSELDEINNIDRVAQNIIKALSRVFILGDEQAYVSASLGIALYPDDAKDANTLVKHADQAMYLSKQRGRGRFSYFTASMQEQAHYRLQLTRDLRVALATNQFEIYYQPIVELFSKRIFKVEALIRWNHPTRGIINPVDFIPLAEDSGLIVDIGDWVFKEAATKNKYWRDKYKIDLQVSVNKSPVQFRTETSQDDWLNYLKNIDLPGSGMVIEITESLLMDNVESTARQLLQFRDAGIQVSMDDFGTGYSALSYLNKFDIDYLKIDRSFTQNLAPGSNDMILSEAIILMSHKLGLKVIAEGIETLEQLNLLAKAGCDYGQGYLFSKPVSETEFEQLLVNNMQDHQII